MQDHHKLKGLWVLIAMTIVSAFFINVPVTPNHQEHTTDTEIIFETIGSATTILVDDTTQFTTPEIYQKGAVVSLKPGTYYWKTTGISLISSFTIISTVALEVERQEETYKLTNVGNVELDVATKQKGLLTGSFVLDAKKDLTFALPEPTTLQGAERYEP